MHDRHVKIPEEVAARLEAGLRADARLALQTQQVYRELLATRRGEGRVTVFGNQGALYRNAMTWWDHGTHSVWSQVWGKALLGPLRGVMLEPIPASIVPWGTWKAENSQTQALDEEGPRYLYRERARDRFVIGLALAGQARGFHFAAVRGLGVLNDHVGPNPVLLYVDPKTRSISAFLRRLGARTLTFALRDGALIDLETGSAWQPQRGIALRGPLKGESLKALAYVPAFRQAWRDFYPASTWYPAP